LLLFVSCGDEGTRQAETPTEPAVASSAPTRTSLHGRVIAIMRDGHVEPARVPSVSLVRVWRSDNPERRTEADEALSAIMPIAPNTTNCSKLLWQYNLALASARAKGSSAREPEILEQKGDEEGKFRFEDVAPGKYRIIAFGQVGWYREVLWDEIIDIEEGEDASVTLNDIARACEH
jgi:hypothetical protein